MPPAARRPPPGHVELLNLMARALGHRNLQSLQAARAGPLSSALAVDGPQAAQMQTEEALIHELPEPPLAAEGRPAPARLSDNVRTALMQFDSRGRLLRWPTKFNVQTLAMWVLWRLFDGRRVYTEREVNEVLKAANAFGDPVTLRRELINHKLMTRKSDCAEYRKLKPQADAETRALLQAWRQLCRSRSTPRVERDDSPRRRQAAAAAAAASSAS